MRILLRYLTAAVVSAALTFVCMSCSADDGKSAAETFDGIRRQRWDWKVPALTYGAIIGADYALTQRCLASGRCVESNQRAQTNGKRLGLAGGMFVAAMASDWLAFRFVHPRATWALRAGLAGHRLYAHADVSF